MSDYTPTTEEVRNHYAYGCGPEHTWAESREDFDRWLAGLVVRDEPSDAAVLAALGVLRDEGFLPGDIYGNEHYPGYYDSVVRAALRAAAEAEGGNR